MEELLMLNQSTEVKCADGVVGQLSRALVDVKRKAVAYLAVADSSNGDVRLVPFERVIAANGKVHLDCTTQDFGTFACADEIESVPDPLAAASGTIQQRTIRRHTIPEGETEVYDDEEVRAKHGKVGRLRALVVDPDDGKIEKLIITVGRIFGKHEVAVPASLIANFDIEEVRLAGSKGEVMHNSSDEAA